MTIRQGSGGNANVMRCPPGEGGGGGGSVIRGVPRKWVCFSHPLVFGLVVKSVSLITRGKITAFHMEHK